MKKSILFIIPSLEIGGTISSLNSIYKEFNYDFDIYVMPLSSVGNAFVFFKEKVIKSPLFINYYIANFKDLNKKQKLFALFVKFFKRICYLWNINLQDILCKHAIRYAEKKHSFDIVVGFQEGIATLAASHSNANKKIAWIHCNYKYYIDECFNENQMYSRFNNIVCVSSFTAKSFKSIMPNHAEKVRYIYNIFNEDIIRKKSNQPINERQFDNSTLTLLTIGRICDIKRFHMIPEIAGYLKKNGIAFKWYIIGPIYQEKEFEKLNEGIERFDLKEHVIWLGAQTNPYPFIKSSDIYICLSLSEACPMVFNEAKILGIPIISTDFGSAHEFINNGEDGFICNICNIGQKIKEYAEDKRVQNKLRDTLYTYKSTNTSTINSIRELFD